MIKKYFQLAVLVFAMLCCCPSVSAAGLIDPTRPPLINSRLGVYDLSEIIIGPFHKMAVIGGHIFHEGDQYQGITVLEIEPNTVKVKGVNGEVTLKLFNSPLKKPARS